MVTNVYAGGIGVGLFDFDLNGAGEAIAVTPAAWRIKLARTS
jgi:hypothetical protein